MTCLRGCKRCVSRQNGCEGDYKYNMDNWVGRKRRPPSKSLINSQKRVCRPKMCKKQQVLQLSMKLTQVFVFYIPPHPQMQKTKTPPVKNTWKGLETAYNDFQTQEQYKKQHDFQLSKILTRVFVFHLTPPNVKLIEKLLPRKVIRAPVKRLTLQKNTKLESTESQCISPQLMQLHFSMLHYIFIILDL